MKILDELEKLEQGATPGPWTYDYGNWEIENEQGRNPVAMMNNHGDDDHPRLACGEDDGALIAAMRNALPALIECAKIMSEIIKSDRLHHRLDCALDAPDNDWECICEVDRAREALAKLGEK